MTSHDPVQQDDVTIVNHYAEEDGPECVSALLLLAGYDPSITLRVQYEPDDGQAMTDAMAYLLARARQRRRVVSACLPRKPSC